MQGRGDRTAASKIKKAWQSASCSLPSLFCSLVFKKTKKQALIPSATSFLSHQTLFDVQGPASSSLPTAKLHLHLPFLPVLVFPAFVRPYPCLYKQQKASFFLIIRIFPPQVFVWVFSVFCIYGEGDVFCRC